ncbi:MAG: tRNA (guanosine(46)-N7)-methyltransferase TrmB, partial [Oscillospiraceae bacterium]|nr:tRNA (guanosine(46)-N7)-methyltransferase TrmB [Oscillospiraceae bacterium]
KKQFKRRLTAPSFLESYKKILKSGGEIHFKTDNVPLFDWSAAAIEGAGYAVSELTHDLHANGPTGVMTDYEKKFYAEGKPICRLVGTKT